MSPSGKVTVHMNMTGIPLLTEAQLALLDRYLADDCSTDDQRAAAELLATRPDLAARLDAIQHALAVSGSHIPDTLQSWEIFRRGTTGITNPSGAHPSPADPSLPGIATNAVTHEDRASRSHVAPRVAVRSHGGVVARWATRLALPGLLLVGAILYQRHRVVTPPSTAQTYATRSGMLETVVLADGSRVTLAPRTVLTVRTAVGNSAYDITLAGEARFEIASHVHAPFVVHAGMASTRVLGTTFVVRRYPGDANGQVMVSSGKVATVAKGSAVTLTAGMMAQFTDSVVTPMATPPGMYTDWVHGQLVFRDEPVLLMLDALKRWYGYDFRLADSTLAARHVSAEFPIGETSQMLQFVKHLLGVNLVFDDSVVTLHSIRDKASSASRQDKLRMQTHTSPALEVGR